MMWLDWIALAAAIVGVMTAWDLLVCGRRRCDRVTDAATADETRGVR